MLISGASKQISSLAILKNLLLDIPFFYIFACTCLIFFVVARINEFLYVKIVKILLVSL